ncbi:MAG: GGDEF domain-containing protein [Spirochaetales bacterium]|nr:MAG: GGDEF domain-containing protein [Spirochaetales bacterium]
MKPVSRKKDKPVRSKRDSLGRVLDQNEEIKDNVEEAADNLASVNDILQVKKAAGVPVQSLKDAIAQNEEAESQVAKAAGDLAQVNTELANEVTERTIIESELVDATINLLEAHEDISSSRAQAAAERTVIESELADMKIDLAEAREDLSKSLAKEEETRQIAFQDALTGLPNRVVFEQALDHGLIQAKRYGRGLAVLFIDIDKFKNVNDLHGHDLGDRVLLMVAERLRSSVRAEDMVSRWGGDEFVCLLLEVKQEADVTRLAKEMVDRIADDWEFNETVLSIRASIGIAIYPADGETAEVLFKKADQAMYKAKGTERRVMPASESV